MFSCFMFVVYLYMYMLFKFLIDSKVPTIFTAHMFYKSLNLLTRDCCVLWLGHFPWPTLYILFYQQVDEW